MKLHILLTALLLAPVLAFAGGKTDSPSEVMKKVIESAFRNMDFETAIPLSHGEVKKYFQTSAEVIAQMQKAADAGDAETKARLAGIKAKYAKVIYEIKGEKIDGDAAVVTVIRKLDGKAETHYFYLVKIDGAWKYTRARRDGK